MNGPAKKSEKSSKNQKSPIFDVNLLIHKEEQVKLQVRLLKWLVSSGRYIVIFVELIVVGAFILRYKLDGELVDLQQQINEQVKYIQTLSADEQEIKQTQFRLSTIKQIHQENPNFTSILFKIATLTPTRMTISNISFNRPAPNSNLNISIGGETPSNVELSIFIKSLQKDPMFTGITLTNISFEERTTFAITGSIIPEGGRES